MIVVEYEKLIEYSLSTGSAIHYFESDPIYDIYVQNGTFILNTEVKKTIPKNATQSDFENTHKALANKNNNNLVDKSPFDSKRLPDGKKIYTRDEGAEFQVSTAENDNVCEFQIPYPHAKFNGIEILNGEIGDKVKLKVLDSDGGSYSGTSKSPLNTFGGKHSYVNVKPGFYERKSNYDADLYGGMYVQILYKTQTDKTIYVNYLLHEVKNS